MTVEQMNALTPFQRELLRLVEQIYKQIKSLNDEVKE